MEIRVNLFAKRFLVILICVAQIALLFFWSINGYIDLGKQIDSYKENLNGLIDQRVYSLADELSGVTKDIGNDLVFAQQLPSLNQLLNQATTSEDIVQGLQVRLSQDLLGFLWAHPSFFSLSYISVLGEEKSKAICEQKNCRIVADASLTSVADIDFFSKLDDSAERDVFIFPPRHSPKYDNEEVMYAAIPLADYDSRPAGFLVGEINADYFLDSVENSGRPGENVFLVDNVGNYVADTEENDAAIEQNTIFQNYPQLPSDILVHDARRWQAAGNIFSFYHIFPTASSYAVHQGAEKIFGPGAENKYYWVLVAVSDRAEMDKLIGGFKMRYLFSVGISTAITLLITGLVLMLCFRCSTVSAAKRKKI
jgi:hypothetical protein